MEERKLTNEEKWDLLPKWKKVFRISISIIVVLFLGLCFLIASLQGGGSSVGSCIGINKDGSSCHNKPAKGNMYCHRHK